MNQVQADVPTGGRPVSVLVVDTTGQLCPIPVLRASQTIKQLEVGGMMEVWATDPGSKSDIPAWTRMTGNELVEVVEEDLDENKERVNGKQATGKELRAYKFRIRSMR